MLQDALPSALGHTLPEDLSLQGFCNPTLTFQCVLLSDYSLVSGQTLYLLFTWSLPHMTTKCRCAFAFCPGIHPMYLLCHILPLGDFFIPLDYIDVYALGIPNHWFRLLTLS